MMRIEPHKIIKRTTKRGEQIVWRGLEQKTEELLIQNYQKYYRIAYLYVKSEPDALDVVQESAYKAIRGCRRIKQEDFLDTWITRIVINTATDLLRRRSSTILVNPQDSPEIWDNPQEDIYQDLDLSRALEYLDDNERITVILRFFEDRKLEEIAQIMEVGVNTVKSRLYRALKKLRITLEA